MARPVAVTPDAIRAAVLAMLAEAGDAVPASDARFRRIVSVRKLRERLGAGDPATLARHLNAIEAEIVQAGLTGFAIPDIPPDVAAQMRAVWELAVATQLDGIVRLRHESEASAQTAIDALRNEQLRVEMLRSELADVRSQLGERDAGLAVARAESQANASRVAVLEDTVKRLDEQLDVAAVTALDAATRQAAELAAERSRYEGLSKQLLLETARQREAFQFERQRLESDITRATDRLGALEALRERLLAELSEQRHACQRAAAEAAGFLSVIEQQRQLLALTGTASGNGAVPTGRRSGRQPRYPRQKTGPAKRAR